MTRANLWVGLIVVCVCSASLMAQAGESLGEPCPINWTGQPLGEAVQELAARIGVPYVLDASVTNEMMARRVRLVASHLTGRQAFRWTLRSVGLEGVLVDGAMVVAQPERLPAAWRLARELTTPGNATGVHEGSMVRTATDGLWQAARARRADLAWVDVPLTRVAREVSMAFGIDVAFDPRVAGEQGLVRLEGSALPLDAVLEAFREQLHASGRYEDGILWVEPAGAANSRPASEPSETTSTELAGPSEPTTMLTRMVSIDSTGAGADRLERAFREAAGTECRVAAAPGVVSSSLQARGGLVEILEAGRLLEGWVWRLDRSGPSESPFLSIEVRGSGR